MLWNDALGMDKQWASRKAQSGIKGNRSQDDQDMTPTGSLSNLHAPATRRDLAAEKPIVILKRDVERDISTIADGKTSVVAEKKKLEVKEQPVEEAKPMEDVQKEEAITKSPITETTPIKVESPVKEESSKSPTKDVDDMEIKVCLSCCCNYHYNHHPRPCPAYSPSKKN